MFETTRSVAGTARRTGGRVALAGSGPAHGWRELWHEVGELGGGVLVLVVWVALWAAVWAAVAGPLSPARSDPPAAVEVADAG